MQAGQTDMYNAMNETERESEKKRRNKKGKRGKKRKPPRLKNKSNNQGHLLYTGKTKSRASIIDENNKDFNLMIRLNLIHRYPTFVFFILATINFSKKTAIVSFDVMV